MIAESQIHYVAGHICARAHPLLGPLDLPLCARCTGIYLVLGLSLLFALFVNERKTPLSLRSVVTAIVFILASPIHAMYFPDSDDWARLMSGALTGMGVALLMKVYFFDTLAVAIIMVAMLLTRSELAFGAATILLPLSVIISFMVPVVRLLNSRTFVRPEIRLANPKS